jgi:putative spermidine/putrescine transport system ATP-binding protein
MRATQADGAGYFQIKNLSHQYGETVALKSVSLELRRDEILALIGPSGSGKSTLLAAIAGMIKPQAGEIVLGGHNLLGLPPEARGLGMVFQDYALWPHMTVGQNIAFPLRARGIGGAEIARRVKEVLARVDLPGFTERRPEQLSGGQKQRVAVARAVIAETRLLLLDEPLSALDPATRLSVRSQLADILRKLGLATIIVTHDREEAFEFADRIALLVDGAVQQFGSAQELYERPANLAVAKFMGINILPAKLLGDREACLDGVSEPLALPCSFTCRFKGELVYLAIAPEQTRIVERGGTNVIVCRRAKTHYRGGEYRVQVIVESGAGQVALEARSKLVPQGDLLHVQLPAASLHVFSQAP